MSQELPVTSYALLGLLTFGGPLTGYELKQRADITLRFYWTAPAMSQVYSELDRLRRHRLVRRERTPGGAGNGAAYSISAKGTKALQHWLNQTQPGFPVLKHPVALRLMLGAMLEPDAVARMLRDHLDAVSRERAALDDVRADLSSADGPGEALHYPAMVADWGLSYFGAEQRLVRDLLKRIEADRSASE